MLFVFSSVQFTYGLLQSKTTLFEELIIKAKTLGNQSIAALEFFDPETAQEDLKALKLDKHIELACLYDKNETLFSFYQIEHATISALQACPKKSAMREGIHDHIASVSYDIMRGVDNVGRLYVESNLELIDDFVIQYLTTTVVLMLVVILLGYLFSLRLQGIISTPIFQLVSTARKLSQEKDYSIRVQKQSEDELGTLVNAFNDMLAQIQARDEDLRQINNELESRINDRTLKLQSANKNLTTSLKQLKQAQNQLIESEKMVALGGLVAGVAHEINTPVGVSVTAASYLEQEITSYAQRYENNNLTREDFESLIEISSTSSKLILANLERAANLIRSFKQIAVDQACDEKRCFNLKNYFSEIMLSLEPELKKYRLDIVIDCNEHFEINSYPGAISQIFTNLVMNSLIHGFEGMENQMGHIEIKVTLTKQQITIIYSDNGKGASAQQIKKIFEPFFTTKRNQGGSGLGMHIVYNLVSRTLGGQILCSSELGSGIKITMLLPIELSLVTTDKELIDR